MSITYTISLTRVPPCKVVNAILVREGESFASSADGRWKKRSIGTTAVVVVADTGYVLAALGASTISTVQKITKDNRRNMPRTIDISPLFMQSASQ
jgi:hypothetical protein